MLELNRQGTTIFLTTHYMEEPEQLADTVAIVSQGEIKAIDTVENLKKMMPSNKIVYIQLSELNDEYANQASELPGIRHAEIQDGILQLYPEHEEPDLNAILNWVNQLDTQLEDIRLSSTSLNDVFIYLTEDKEAK